MQDQLTPSASNLQPQSSGLQQGQAGLQQTGGVTTSDNTTSLLSEQPPTNQLRVANQGQPSTISAPPPQTNPPVGLWLLFAMAFVFIAIGLVLRRRSSVQLAPEDTTVSRESTELRVQPVPKLTKTKKKQSRKKRSNKR